jgi:hypothetical protein
MALLEPGLIGVMGDVHANEGWTLRSVRGICEKLHEESPKIILQAGDFGMRPEREFQLSGLTHRQEGFPSAALSQLLEDNDAELWFCEGNHEDHDMLDRLAEGSREGRIKVAGRITWLRRGERWSWHGRTWLACGGAVSVDKLLRRQGVSWFPQETISRAEEFFISAMGPADVLLSHDAPSDVPLRLFNPPPGAWLPMIPAAEEHRDRLQRICLAVKPSYIFHGHYHQSQVITRYAAWGKCRFTSLDMDGTQENWGILDTRTMEWEWQ